MIDRAVELGSVILSYPVLIPVTLSSCALFAAFALRVARSDLYAASAYLAAALALLMLFSEGFDYRHHSARLLELTRSIRTGELDLFVHFGDQALPVFYYYSSAVYVFALPFSLAGIGADLSMKIVMTVSFVLMALSARSLFRLVARDIIGSDRPDLAAGAATVVLLTSNYAYANFSIRNAVPEALVYALIPAVLLAFLSRRTPLACALVILQMCIHPPVVPQALVAVAIPYLALSAGPFLSRAARLVSVYAIATVASVPAWLWALREKGAILGVEGLPVTFEETFLSAAELLNPFQFSSTGFFLWIALGIALLSRERTWPKGLFLAGAAALLLLLQTQPLAPLVVKIPLADIGLFIVRWMFVVVWLGALAFLLIRKPAGVTDIPIRVLLVMAAVQAMLLTGRELAVPEANSTLEESSYFAPRDAARPSWGRSEFYPAYDGDPNRCAQLIEAPSREVSFRDLMQAPVPSDANLAVDLGPLAGVTYLAGAEPAQTVGCGQTLYVTHPSPGTLLPFSLERDLMMRFPGVKLFYPLAALALAALVLLTGRRRTVS